VLRRSAGRPQRGTLRVGELVVDPRTRSVRMGGAPLHLSAKEFALLQALAQEPGRVRSKNELLRDVWGYVAIGRTRTVDAHACRLRKKLSAASARTWVVSVRGVGYKLCEES
jgi:DNA-binding response OmpR family regulator